MVLLVFINQYLLKYMSKGIFMSHDNEEEILRIFRLLTPKNQADLLNRVYLAYTMEESVRKSVDFSDIPRFKNTGVSCKNKTGI